MNKFSFSGHESFICRQLWLKKAFDFARGEKAFNDESAVVELGVGKNMVTSLRFWGKAFGILTEDDFPTKEAEYLFGPKGKDIYLEDLGTIWLLHYFLVRTNRASIYSLVFHEFRKERVDFTKEQLHAFLKRKCEESESTTYTKTTIDADITVFLRNYVSPEKGNTEVEDSFSGVLFDLGLVKHYKQRNDEGKITDWYKIEPADRVDLPPALVLYSILTTYENQKSITFHELLTGQNSPGVVFALNADGLYTKLKQIAQAYPQVLYSETAGNQLLQFKSTLTPQAILDDYYRD